MKAVVAALALTVTAGLVITANTLSRWQLEEDWRFINRDPSAQRHFLDLITANKNASNKSSAPAGINFSEPAIIFGRVLVENIGGIDEQNMVLDIDMVLEQQWTMTQPVCGLMDAYFQLLPFDDESTKPAYRCRRLFATVFWMPDTFFPDASSAYVLSDPFSKKSLCLVTQRGTCYFKYIERLCFQSHIATFHYYWETEAPVSMNPEISLSSFRVELRPQEYTDYNRRSHLRLALVLTRQLAPQLIEAYIPSAFLVVVSWLIFWLGPSTERVAVCVTLLLALYSQSTGARQLLPPSTSVTALDHWMVACVFFVFAALAQTAHGVWSRRPLPGLPRTTVHRLPWIRKAIRAIAVRTLQFFTLSRGGASAEGKPCTTESSGLFSKADKISRFAFPAAFAVFSVVYWSVIYG
ncbi:hypothetical protein MTO96_032942 [Rhipicephalus appendiculatus]